ncbi:hypothetical protein A4G20_06555 [Pasteurellaceae bacterium RH1A]|nr:hypothetical protein A4G20_06555 [Pasteurellaceae bacterium RH1A]
MYLAKVCFTYEKMSDDALLSINHLINQWRYNGQIIGKEIPVTHQINELGQPCFQASLVLPEMDSLSEAHNSPEVENALALLAKHGLAFTQFEVEGLDYNSDGTSEYLEPSFQILYTTHLETASPLHSGDDFWAIPLYTLKDQALSQKILKWQEDWQACDQLQMNGNILEAAALAEISEHTSRLSQRGIALCQEIEKKTAIPTYYYLYRLGQDEAQEQDRKCPCCSKPWKLAEPLHEIFHFQCEACRLISNLSWELA